LARTADDFLSLANALKPADISSVTDEIYDEIPTILTRSPPRLWATTIKGLSGCCSSAEL
jgi:hypothetical protein